MRQVTSSWKLSNPTTLMTVSGSSPFGYCSLSIYYGPGSLLGTSHLILAKNPWTRVTNIPCPSCGGEYKGSDRSSSQDCMSTIPAPTVRPRGLSYLSCPCICIVDSGSWKCLLHWCPFITRTILHSSLHPPSLSSCVIITCPKMKLWE